jgi:hypothetical protein
MLKQTAMLVIGLGFAAVAAADCGTPNSMNTKHGKVAQSTTYEGTSMTSHAEVKTKPSEQGLKYNPVYTPYENFEHSSESE